MAAVTPRLGLSMLRLLTGALLIVLVPCGVTAQDTLVVRADNPPVWGENPRLVEELRIGVLEGDLRYVLGEVRGVVEAPDGAIWIADRDLGALRRYSPIGEHLDDVGRKGDGPGEFRLIGSIRLLPDGRVGVLDEGTRRIEFFGLDGSHMDEVTPRLAGLGTAAGLPTFEVDADGGLYVLDVDARVLARMPTRAATPVLGDAFQWLRLSPSGEILDTLPAPATRAGGGHATRSVQIVSPLGYLVSGRNDEYALHWRLRDGRTVRIERSWEPVPYEREERQELQANEDWGSRPEQVPETKPSWSRFGMDADGRMWISRYMRAAKIGETPSQRERRLNPPSFPGLQVGDRPPRPAITWGQPEVFDVIEPTGRYLGMVTLPKSESSQPNPRAWIALAHDMTVWVVERGLLDEEYVVKYRIVPGP